MENKTFLFCCRIAVYKALYPLFGGFVADVMAAIDQVYNITCANFAAAEMVLHIHGQYCGYSLLYSCLSLKSSDHVQQLQLGDISAVLLETCNGVVLCCDSHDHIQVSTQEVFFFFFFIWLGKNRSNKKFRKVYLVNYVVCKFVLILLAAFYFNFNRFMMSLECP